MDSRNEWSTATTEAEDDGEDEDEDEDEDDSDDDEDDDDEDGDQDEDADEDDKRQESPVDHKDIDRTPRRTHRHPSTTALRANPRRASRTNGRSMFKKIARTAALRDDASCGDISEISRWLGKVEPGSPTAAERSVHASISGPAPKPPAANVQAAIHNSQRKSSRGQRKIANEPSSPAVKQAKQRGELVATRKREALGDLPTNVEHRA